MKRRSFLQSIIAGVTALFLPKVKALAKTIEYEKVTECKNEDFTEYWGGPLAKRRGWTRKEDCEYIKFGDEIVSIEKFAGRCLVFCKHSVWEIETNCYGEDLTRKLIRKHDEAS